jgi:hypothetical protein
MEKEVIWRLQIRSQNEIMGIQTTTRHPQMPKIIQTW